MPGTRGDDFIEGTESAETIKAMRGDDVGGNGGSDTIYGEELDTVTNCEVENPPTPAP